MALPFSKRSWSATVALGSSGRATPRLARTSSTTFSALTTFGKPMNAAAWYSASRISIGGTPTLRAACVCALICGRVWLVVSTTSVTSSLVLSSRLPIA